MLSESRLNIYILGSDLSPRLRERIQAQVQTALRSLPPWVFDLIRRRIDALGVANLPLIIEPLAAAADGSRVLSLGRTESRPAVKLTPRLHRDGVDWGQDLRRLLAKAAAYISAPAEDDTAFWSAWARASQADRLRDLAAAGAGDAFRDETDLGLLIEMFAAYALNPGHARWREMPAVRAFLEGWRHEVPAG